MKISTSNYAVKILVSVLVLGQLLSRESVTGSTYCETSSPDREDKAYLEYKMAGLKQDEDKKASDDMSEGGLSEEQLAEIARSIPDLELDFTSRDQKFLSGIERSMPFAPVVQHLRGAMPQMMQGVQANQPAVPPQAPGGGNPAQNQNPGGQRRGPPPPPQQYVWEDGDIAGSVDSSDKIMLC